MSHGVFSVIAPTENHVRMFKEQLWKEQRRLMVVDGHDRTRLLRKAFNNRSEVESELQFLRLLSEFDPTLVPAVFDHGEKHVDLEYVEGMRVYNVLEILKAIKAEDDWPDRARRLLLDRCVVLCKRTHSAFVEGSLPSERKYYSIRQKLIQLLALFDHCLALDLEIEDLDLEIEWAEDYLDRLSCTVPFRDASPKNLILAWPDIWRGRATPSLQTKLVHDAAVQWIKTESSPLAEERIVNIDFSSCRELTVPEDDPISLLVHESSWFGNMPAARQLLWQDIEPDPARLAIGLAVRMYRFGGRRLGYRIVHSNGYRRRYEDESIDFYFRCLLSASESICTDLKLHFPVLLLATKSILARLDEGLYTEVDWFETTYGPQPDRYYRDVYPY